MEDTWSYITAFIGHSERAIRGLCQDSLLISPPYSVSPVSLLPCLHSAEGLSDKKVQKWPTCCCFAPVCVWVCYNGLQTWLCWPVGELPADKETWLTGTSARRMASLLWKRQVIETRWWGCVETSCRDNEWGPRRPRLTSGGRVKWNHKEMREVGRSARMIV